jgi:hypothetical protein
MRLQASRLSSLERQAPSFEAEISVHDISGCVDEPALVPHVTVPRQQELIVCGTAHGARRIDGIGSSSRMAPMAQGESMSQAVLGISDGFTTVTLASPASRLSLSADGSAMVSRAPSDVDRSNTHPDRCG